MRTGFSFKGIHTNDLGVTSQTKSRPIRPETKKQTYEVPLQNGEYDFSASNIYGHEFYKDRIFQMDILVSAENHSALQKKLGKVSSWLMGIGELIFDDTPSVKWDAKVVDTVEYKPEKGNKTILSVSFTVKAFAELVFDVLEGPCLDDTELMLDSNIPIDLGEYFKISGMGSHMVQNIGDMPVKPVVTVSGAVTVTCNGGNITVPKASVIDCERCTVTDSTGKSIMNSVSGSFFELLPGTNEITLSAAVSADVSYSPKYVHNADLNNTNWGE